MYYMKNILKVIFILAGLLISTHTIFADIAPSPVITSSPLEVLAVTGVIVALVVIISAIIIHRIKKNGNPDNK
jgi:hypothetical protein